MGGKAARGRGTSVGLRFRVGVASPGLRGGGAEETVVAQLDTDVQLSPGAPLRCVAAANTELAPRMFSRHGDTVLFQVRCSVLSTSCTFIHPTAKYLLSGIINQLEKLEAAKTA